ncbi:MULTISPECIES: TIR domain-containing protein [unclassified Bradyrhizobium]
MDDFEAFWGTDPLAAETALHRLAANGPDIIKELLPLGSAWPTHSWHSSIRLTRLCKILGPQVAQHLLTIIENETWHAKTAVSPCFSAFVGDSVVRSATYQLLQSKDIDVQRIAIEALGYAAASESAYSIAETARYGRPGQVDRYRTIDKYTMGKLAYYAIQATLRIFARIGEASLLQSCEELLRDFQQAVRDEDYSWDIDLVMGELEPRAADALIARWLTHPEDKYRGHAMVGLGHLRLRRTVPRLASFLEDDSIGVGAGIALGNIVHPEAARHLAAIIGDGATCPGIGWALSALYGLRIDWPQCSELAFSIAQGDDEIAAQMRYSLAVRGEKSVLQALDKRLNASDPFIRGTSAIALARLLGTSAKPLLEDRERETSEPIESLLVLTALIHSGSHHLVTELDKALQKFPMFSRLRPIWTREILGAFIAVEGAHSTRAALWAEIGCEDLSRVVRELEALGIGKMDASSPPAKEDMPSTSVGNSPASVFVSYSHKDGDWLKKFQTTLKPLIRKGSIDLWDDTRLRPGSNWKDSIDLAMQQANVALLLASHNFLASDFVVQHELKTLLQAAKTRGVKIVWVAIDHALYEETELNDIQAANNPQMPLVELTDAQLQKEIVRICRDVRDIRNC